VSFFSFLVVKSCSEIEGSFVKLLSDTQNHIASVVLRKPYSIGVCQCSSEIRLKKSVSAWAAALGPSDSNSNSNRDHL
jgi:hypothetical protein